MAVMGAAGAGPSTVAGGSGGNNSSSNGNSSVQRSASASSADVGGPSNPGAPSSYNASARPGHGRFNSIDGLSSSKLAAAHHHHPFRLEVSAVTPVSVLLSWSVRPPPLSAIPRAPGATASKHGAIQQGSQGYASSHASTSSSPVQQRNKRNSGDARRHLTSTSTVTATRGPNRKVTKVKLLRNSSPGKALDGPSKGHNDGHKRHASGSPSFAGELPASRRGSEDWPSDDGATVVDEDEEKDFSLNVQDGRRGSTNESAVTVLVNGVPWRQVLMGDGAGEDETFVAVYGLAPGRKYDILLAVEGAQSKVQIGTPQEASIEPPSVPAVEALREGAAMADVSSADESQGRVYRTHTPPMQDTDGESPGSFISGTVASGQQEGIAQPPNNTNGTGVSASALQAAIRKAKKEASRAESAMRHEIDAIKRGLDRMSDVDHRSKQKVLALQESIRQATIQTKSIDEEALAVENERESWEARDVAKGEELEAVRQEIEEKMRISDAEIKSDNDHIAALDKDLGRAAKTLDEKRAAKEKLEKERVVELEAELARIQGEIDKVLKQPPPPPAQFAAPASHYHQQYGTPGMHHSAPPASSSFNSGQGQMAPAGYQHPHGAPSLIPPQALGRGGRGRGGGNAGAARGGGMRGTMGGTSSWRGGSLNYGPQVRSAYYAGNFPSQGPSSAGHASDDYHQNSFEQASPIGHHSLLNPNKPEFVPGNAGSMSPSPATSKLHFMNRPQSNSALAASSHGHDFYDDDQSPGSLFASSNAMQSPDSSVPGSSTTWPVSGRAPPPAAASPWKQAAVPAAGLPGSPHFGQDIWGVNSIPSPQHRPSPLMGGNTMPPSTSSPLHMHGPLDANSSAPASRFAGALSGATFASSDALQRHPQRASSGSSNTPLPGFNIPDAHSTNDLRAMQGPLDLPPPPPSDGHGHSPLYMRGSDSPLSHGGGHSSFFGEYVDPRRHLDRSASDSPHNSFTQ